MSESQTQPAPALNAKGQNSRGSYASGDRIADKYRLVRKLGEGGMATVWVAHNELLDLNVAIKLIRAEVTSISAASRLLQEARAGASIDHPAIIRVFDFGKTDAGDPFIVMELLDGDNCACQAPSIRQSPDSVFAT